MRLNYMVYGFVEVEQSNDSIHPYRHYYATIEERDEKMKQAGANPHNACYAFEYEKEIDV